MKERVTTNFECRCVKKRLQRRRGVDREEEMKLRGKLGDEESVDVVALRLAGVTFFKEMVWDLGKYAFLPGLER